MTDAATATPARTARKRTVLMCRPEYFTVSYRINPWMHPEDPTDTSLAVRQWDVLYRTYLDLGFEVHLIDPIAGLPDMVYAANGGFVIDNIAYGASFTYPERQPEGPAYMDWFREAGFDVRVPEEINEGEGDFLLVNGMILAGTGFRTASNSHEEIARIYGREVVSLNLITRASTTSIPPSRFWMTRTSRTSRVPSTRHPSPPCAGSSPMPSSSPRRTRRCWASTRSATATTS